MNRNTPHLHDPAIEETTDEIIDRALAGLRDAQPRSGLNTRVLAALEHRAARSPAKPLVSSRTALWCACSAALAVASFAILHHRAPNRNAVILSGAQRAEPKNPETVGPSTNLAPFSAANLAQISHTLSSRPKSSRREDAAARAASRNCQDHQHTGCPIHAEGVGGVELDPEAQALADLHAPSHPAPPLPLTPQEKLFLRTLRLAGTTELAELNPEVRAKEAADETSAFKSFFPDPPPLKPTGDTQ